MVRCVVFALLVAVTACGPGRAEPISPAVQDRLVALEARVAALERGPEPEPPAPSLAEAQTDFVIIRIRTQPVAAKVVEAGTGKVLGVTNGEDGIAVPASEVPMDLILRAAGYAELLFSVVPTRDKVMSKQLRRQ